MTEASTRDTERPGIGDVRLGSIHRGGRYIYGFGRDFYGIWDVVSEDAPAERFAATLEGKRAGWNRYVELEPDAADASPFLAEETARSGAELTRLKARRQKRIALAAVAGVVVIGVVVGILLAKTNSATTAVDTAALEKINNKAHIDVTGTANASEDLDLQAFKAEGLDSLFGVIDASWKGASSQLHFSIQGPKLGETQTSDQQGVVLDLTVDKGGTPVVYASTHGQCTITLTVLDSAHLSGSFTCSGIPDPTNPANTIDAQGTFSAKS